MENLRMEWHFIEHSRMPVVKMVGTITEGRESLELLLATVITLKLAAGRLGEFYVSGYEKFEPPTSGKVKVHFYLRFPSRRAIARFKRAVKTMFP